jgi:hypothetical protein
MKKEHPRVNGKKPKCLCGHLLERHTHIGACTARREVPKGVNNNCPCVRDPFSETP